MSAIKLRVDYDAARTRRLAARAKDPDQVRRLLALAAVYEGRSRAEAAELAGMDRQTLRDWTLRDWALRFNALGPEGLINRPPPGARRCLSPQQEQALGALVEAGPEADGRKGVAGWRCCDLQTAIAERFGVRVHERTVGKLLKRLGFSHITARPQHYRQDIQAQVDFKKTSQGRWRVFNLA